MCELEFVKPNILVFKDDLGSTSIDDVITKMNDIIDTDVVKIDEVIADLKNVDYITSIGIGMFIQFTRKFEKKGKKLRLINVSSNIYRLFDVVGALKLITIDNITEKNKGRK